MTFSIEEIATTSGLAAIQPEWADLCDRCPSASPFQRPEWIIAWCRHAGLPQVWTLAVRSAARLVALAPWLVYDEGGRRVVGFLAGGISDYHDVVAEPGLQEGACRALFDHLAMRRLYWDECYFEELGPAALLRGARASAEWTEERCEQAPCPRLDLPRGASSLGSVVPSAQLARLRKYRRKATQSGRMKLELALAASRSDALEELLALYDARWATRAGAPAMPNRSFHESVIAGLAGGVSNAVIHRLTLEGRLLAALYGFVSRGVLYCYMQAFDPAFAHLSPGTLLVGAVLEDALARELAAVDFLRGTEPYKSAWGARGLPNLARRFRSPV
jgi:CelD/BcsL family acetyltransferase involved in cellulose biosynthesis